MRVVSRLYRANLLVISLGALYTLFGTTYLPDETRARVQPLVEVLLTLTVVASCLFAALYLAYGYWGNAQLQGLSKDYRGTPDEPSRTFPPPSSSLADFAPHVPPHFSW